MNEFPERSKRLRRVVALWPAARPPSAIRGAAQNLADGGVRPPNGWHAGAVVLLGLAVAWLNGCATEGYHKGDAAATSLQSAAAQVEAESGALNVTLDALKDLFNQTGTDLKPAYRRFCADLDRLSAAAQRTQTTGDRMAEKNAAYFQAWEQQLTAIEFEHIRDLSATRRAEVTNRFERIHQRYQQSQDVVQPLIAYLQDLRKALGVDLTPESLASLKDIQRNAETNSAKVRVALAALTDELTNSSVRMSSVRLQSSQVRQAMSGTQ